MGSGRGKQDPAQLYRRFRVDVLVQQPKTPVSDRYMRRSHACDWHIDLDVVQQC